MPIPKSIQITIPSPCSQSWEDMTPDGEGRFCDHCSETVIDFTGWSDRALFDFFSKDRGQICGHISASRLERPLHIPPQPHSRLYRMVIAMGLTLLFVQGAHVYAQTSPPIVQTQSASITPSPSPKDSANFSIVKGTVVDEKKVPIIGATVRVLQERNMKGTSVTDIDGYYKMTGVENGTYHMVVEYLGYKTVDILNVKVDGDTACIQNVAMVPETNALGAMIIHRSYRNWDEPGHHTFRREEINHMPIR